MVHTRRAGDYLAVDKFVLAAVFGHLHQVFESRRAFDFHTFSLSNSRRLGNDLISFVMPARRVQEL